MIKGIGVDVVELKQFSRVMGRHPRRFVERVFTESERAYCEGRPNKLLHYMARYAAKEAFLKALGTGYTMSIRWQDVQVLRERNGRVYLKLGGRARALCKSRGIRRVHVSLSHTRDHAVATVVLES